MKTKPKIKVRKKFKLWLQARGLSDRTLKEYMMYYRFFGGKKNMNQEYVDQFIRRQKYSSPSKAFVKNFITFLVRENLCETDIYKIDIPKRTGRKKKSLVQYLSIQEIALMERGMTKERDKLMLLVNFYSGARISGLLNIKPFDFNWRKWDEDRDLNGELKLTEKGNKQRIVFIPPYVMERLERWIIKESKRLLLRLGYPPNPLDPLFKMSRSTWRHIVSRASIKKLGKHSKTHAIRHGTGTWLKSCGWDLMEIKEYLGHEDVKTTQIYAHIDKRELASKFREITNY